MVKKLSALILALALAFSFTTSAMANTTVTFSYPDGAFDDEEMNASVVYDDSFFSQKATKQNDSLALLSAGAASAVYNKDDIRDFLKTCGYTNRRDSVKDETSGNDLSFNFGKRKIGKKTVVAVILQGTASSAEWKSNLDLGFDNNMKTDSIHHGFNVTEKAVHKKLNTFLKKNNLKKGNVKFWVTGHSRGAAVADIMAKRLSDTYGKDNVYAYTFASPKVSRTKAASAKKYINIFNYVNSDDIVTQIPTKDSKTLEKALVNAGLIDEETLTRELSLLGLDSSVNYTFGTYRRYGRDITMSSSDHDTMEQTFSDITGTDFDSSSVAHNHCQSCYISWLMG
ncbi:MAG: lipase family protein [Lachnospiraceae bacterium]|nr:lipase family protein [Lachnospiraceae bacterium]MDD7326467.1 lipase family protein [Lachnospiraceae bacterium]MDY2759245.1 lipase family protein [Lachnospiraceae bacterium]